MSSDAELADTLLELLDGDFVELSTDDRTVTAEVIDHDRETLDDGRWQYTVRFMPVGEDATRVTPDRYRITIRGGDDTGVQVSELIAEVFVEADPSYELEPRGPVLTVEALGRP